MPYLYSLGFDMLTLRQLVKAIAIHIATWDTCFRYFPVSVNNTLALAPSQVLKG